MTQTTQSAPGPTVVQESPKKKPKSQKKSTASRPKAAKILPTVRIAFDKQLDILRGYGAASANGTKVATINDVAAIVKMAPTTVSMCNAFLVSNGLIQRSDSCFMPAAEVVSFLRAYEWNRETAATKLAPVIQQSWFFQAISPKLTFGPMEEQGVVTSLAEAAAAGPGHRKELCILIDYMVAAGLIQKDGSQIRLIRNGASVVETPTQAPKSEPARSADQPIETQIKSRVVTAFTQSTEGAVHFNVSVRVDMAEFAGWEPDRISAFFGGIAKVLAAKAGLEEEVGT